MKKGLSMDKPMFLNVGKKKTFNLHVNDVYRKHPANTALPSDPISLNLGPT